jgi:pantothenate kinase
MKTAEDIAGALLDPVLAAPRKGRRRLVAVAGPPASGKSTVASILADKLSASGCPAQVIPMDGFHLDNGILTRLGLLERKGAPETFDAAGFLRLINALAVEDTVYFPKFDRSRDIAIAGAGSVDAECDSLVVEGNYLLLDQPVWRDLVKKWDFSVMLVVQESELERRLVRRWLDQGMSPAAAKARARENDLRNAAMIAEASVPATTTFQEAASPESR